MIKFSFHHFYLEKRLSQKELSDITATQRGSLSIMEYRGTIKPSFLRKLETIFGDCTKYIITDPPKPVKRKLARKV